MLAGLPAGFSEVTVTSGLSSPTAMDFSPNGELWALEEDGDVIFVRTDGTKHEALSLTVNNTGERGLLGITFDPSYDGSGPNTDYIYLYYTHNNPTNNRLSRFTVTGAGTATPSLGSELVLRDLPPNTEDNDSNHNGGALHFGPDGKLYLAVGDHNYDQVSGAGHVSQITSTPFGKMLRLNPDGTNPTDNPFYDGNANDWEGSIWALGLRNPFTFSFDAETGAMFINDVGESTWEEINLGEAGANYGWAGSNFLIEGFQSSPPWPNYRDPIMAYDHSGFDGAPAGLAITGGAFAPSNGPYGSDFAGLYFFSDYGPSFIRIFDPDDPGTSQVPGVTEGDEDTSSGFATSASSPVDLKIGPDGNLYYLGRTGGVIRRITYAGGFGPTQVDERQIFYNQSVWDNDDAGIDEADDAAIATDKVAYRPGDGLAGPQNATSYSRGITGIMVDLSGNHGPLTLDDFSFKMSPTLLAVNNAPSTWMAAPTPSGFDVRAGAGNGGSDRVEIVWDDGAIADRWLEVTVEGNDAAGGFNANTGLATSDIFYFGNKIGDTFTFGEAGGYVVDNTDQILARNNQGQPASAINIFDFNRDAVVDATDEILARNNQGAMRAIDISDPPGAPSAEGDDGSLAVASALSIRATARGESPVTRVEVRPSSSEPRVARTEADQQLPDAQAPRSVAILAAADDVAALDEGLLDALLADLAED